jgi:sodium-dependent dicarboxylate transporter 2/3/5
MKKEAIGFLLGILLFAVVLVVPAPASFQDIAARAVQDAHASLDPAVLVASMRSVLAVLALMIVWWLTEAVPLPVTALLPAVAFPLLHVTGLQHGNAMQFTLPTVVVNYANPVIFLFLGGFLLAGSMRKWNLDRRLILWLLSRGALADDARLILLALMSVTALLSMWVSNTATTALMLPLGIGILSLMGSKPGQSNYGRSVMLGIAWAASIGGVGTIIGTPPNGIALGILHNAFADDPGFRRITFLDWMKFGVPYVAVFLPLAWFVLLRVFPPEAVKIEGGRQRLLSDYAALGPMSRGEKLIISVFFSAAALWMLLPFREQLFPGFLNYALAWFDEYTVGIAAGVALFLIPVNLRRAEFILDWRDADYVEWGVLILFGGGIALSDAMFRSGLASWVASSFIGLFGSPSTLAMMFIVVILVGLLTEVTSNTAVATMMVPIVISIARATGENPTALAITAAIASSLAFMLPVATPPNAMVFSTGHVSIKDMVKAGIVLEVLGWVFTVGIMVVVAHLIFHVIEL